MACNIRWFLLGVNFSGAPIGSLDTGKTEPNNDCTKELGR